MDFEASLSEVFLEPAPLALWQLRSELVVGGFSEQDTVMVVLDNFYNFLNELVASSTAREYSHFASLLDIAAVGGVVLESLIGEKDLNEHAIGNKPAITSLHLWREWKVLLSMLED
jgi:hypothetical protein